MADIAGQGFNSNIIYRHWLDETFDGHENGEDDLSGSLHTDCDTIQPRVKNLPLRLEPLEPYLGMEFRSAEDAREFYELYGWFLGFTIRNNRTRRSLKDNKIIGREFVCSKEGFRPEKYMNKEIRSVVSRPATREGCNAMMRIAAKDGAKWMIYCFVKEHNHELNPSKVPPRRSDRIAMYEDEKDLKIRELSTELHREKKRSAAYREQLEMILKYVEEHTEQLSVSIDVVYNTVKELELEDDDSDIE